MTVSPWIFFFFSSIFLSLAFRWGCLRISRTYMYLLYVMYM